MVMVVRKYRRDPNIIMAARDITTAAPERDARATINLLQSFVRDRIKYVHDPREIEMVQTPPQTLTILTGDCDDKATLLTTLLETLGFHTRFLAISEDSGGYSHVMAQVMFGGRWVNLETILPGVGVGWFPPNVSRDPPPMAYHV